ncbi:hypothetical protein R6Q57_029690 [Mikania cordata]
MNPRPNNLNPEFNPFSYDPESLRNFCAQLQQNPNFQHFQPPPNFQPGFAVFSQPRFKSDFVSPIQPENEVVSETQDTLKRKKGKKNKQPAGQGRVVVQWHQNNGPPMKKPLSEDASWTNPRTKPKVIRKNAKTFGKKSPLVGTG